MQKRQRAREEEDVGARKCTSASELEQKGDEEGLGTRMGIGASELGGKVEGERGSAEGGL